MQLPKNFQKKFPQKSKEYIDQVKVLRKNKGARAKEAEFSQRPPPEWLLSLTRLIKPSKSTSH